MLGNPPRAVAGVAGFFSPPTLDKMMSDHKHLVSAEVDKLIAAVKGTRNEARDRCLLLLNVSAWVARVRGLRVSVVLGGHRKPRPARQAAQRWTVHHAP